MFIIEFCREAIIPILAALIIFTAAGIFKRYFLSLPAVYHVSMLLSILMLIFSASVTTDGMSVEWYLNVNRAVLILSLAIYIRGHIFPLDLKKYKEQKPLYAAKRLIFTGLLGIGVFALFAAVTYGKAVWEEMHYVPTETSFEDMSGIGDMLAFIMFIAMACLAGLLVTNGCIRYILTADKTKGKKALYILLTFIPIFNIVYGVICLKKINKALKVNY